MSNINWDNEFSYPEGGMPSTDGSGKAFVSVDGKMVAQDGYGYSRTVSLFDGSIKVEDGHLREDDSLTQELVAGKKYDVIFDGVVYDQLEAITSGFFVQIGDKELTDYPFCIQGFGSMLDLYAGDGDHTLKIVGREYVQMNHEYLPNSNVLNGPPKSGSVVLGLTNSCSGSSSLAGGYKCEGQGSQGIAFGYQAIAKDQASFALGVGVVSHASQLVTGYYNVEKQYTRTNSDQLLIVGNGGGPSKQHNAFVVEKSGALIVPASDDPSKYFKITVTSDGVIHATEAAV